MDQNPSIPFTLDNPLGQRKHSHYFKSTRNLTEVDVYRVCDLFKVTDHSGCIQHAIKKLLLPGNRGIKTEAQDIQEAVDTLNRKLEMLREDASPNKPGVIYSQDSPPIRADSAHGLLRALVAAQETLFKINRKSPDVEVSETIEKVVEAIGKARVKEGVK